MGELNTKIKSGVFWSTLDFLSKTVLQFVLQIVLARVLFPEDFGLVGMAVVFSTIIRAFVEFGMGAALIQLKEREFSDSYLYTAYWTGLVVNIILYLLIYIVVSPLIATFYDEPQLEQIFPVLSLGIIINSFNMVQLVKLTRELDFRSLTIIGFISTAVATVISILMAYTGFGIWSIVVHQPLVAFISLPLYLLINRWVPKLHWNKQEFKKIFSFGLYTSGTQITNSINSQLDFLLIGKLLSAQPLGLYSLAFQVTDLVKSKVVTIVTKVMYPVYAKIQDDKERVRSYYEDVIKFNFLIIAPIMSLMVIFAYDLVTFIFGDKWEASVPLVRILAIGSLIQVLASSNTSLIRGIGYPKLEFMLQFFKAVFIFIPSIIIGVYLNGIIGASWAVVVNYSAAVIIAHIVLYRLIGYSLKNLWQAIRKTLFMLIVSTISWVVFKVFIGNFYAELTVWVVCYIVIGYFLYKSELKALLKFK